MKYFALITFLVVFTCVTVVRLPEPDLAKIRKDLTHFDHAIKNAALDSLRLAEPDDAAPLLPLVLDTLSDKNCGVRGNSARTLGKLAVAPSPAIIEGLIDRLDDSEWHVRMEAAEALGKFGDAAIPATPALERASQDSDERVQDRARIALGLIGSTQSCNTAPAPVLQCTK